MAVLPEDIIHDEILLRLPINSLVRFLLVSKSWFSHILDPDFAQSHLSQNPNPGNDDQLILNTNNYSSSNKSTDDPNYYISIISRSNLSESRINKVPYRMCSEHIQLIGSVNGLICIACLSKQYYYFILWNPAICRFKKIFPQKHFRKTLKPYDTYLFAFGWYSVQNDYKIIVKLPQIPLQYAVYSSETDSWTEIVMSEDYINFDPYASKTPAAIVKGCPYWFWTWSRNTQSILKFEIERNDFMLFEFPSNVRQQRYNLFNMNDCLGRLQYRAAYGGGEHSVDVYSLNEECKVWNMIYTINLEQSYYPLTCFKYGGDILLYGKKNLYDHKSKQIRSITYDKKGHFINAFSHTPSLVLVKGMKTLEGQRPRR